MAPNERDRLAQAPNQTSYFTQDRQAVNPDAPSQPRAKTPIFPEDDWEPVQSYPRLVISHLLALLAQIVLIAAFVLLVRFGWYYPKLPYYPHRTRWPEFGIGAAAWLASEGLRKPLFGFFVRAPSGLASWASGESANGRLRSLGLVFLTLAPVLVHTATQELLRLGAVAISAQFDNAAEDRLRRISEIGMLSGLPTPHPRHSPPVAMFRSFWLALGWASAECFVRSARIIFKHLPLYREVLEDERNWEPVIIEAESALSPSGQVSIRRLGVVDEAEGDEDLLDVQTEDEEALIDASIRARKRIELELLYGAPLSHLPVALIVLHALNSILLALAITPWLYLSQSVYWRHALLSWQPSIPIAWLIAFAVHATLSALWSIGMPRIGLASISLVSLLLICAALVLSWISAGAII